jgi:hypothetical protein
MLIINRHKSHITYELVHYATEMGIKLLPLPSHLTHLLQPLDSVPFQQLKKNHADKVNKISYISGQIYDKVHFLNNVHFIRTKTFTPSVISVGWRETGLYTVNSDLVLGKVGALEVFEKPVEMLDDSQIIGHPADDYKSMATSINSGTGAALASAPRPSTSTSTTPYNSTNCTLYAPPNIMN